MDTSITLKTKSADNKKNTTTLTNVNPTASNATLLEYAQRMASLSTDTYSAAEKVEKSSLDNDTRLPRNTAMVFCDETVSAVQASLVTAIADFEWNSDQLISIEYTGASIDSASVIIDKTNAEKLQGNYIISQPQPGSSDIMLFIGTLPGATPLAAGESAYFTVHADATADYQALDFVVTIQGGNG